MTVYFPEREALQDKLLAILSHKTMLEDEKKAITGSYAEQIKGANRKIKALTSALKDGDLSVLMGPFDPTEVDQFCKPPRAPK